MTPIQRFKAALAQSQNEGCSANSTVQRAFEEYQKQVEQANQQFQKKQRQEQEKCNEIDNN